MKRTSAELKRMAREHLNGRWGLMMGAMVLVNLIMSAACMPFCVMVLINPFDLIPWLIYMAALIIIGLAASILQAGLTDMYLKNARNQQTGLGMAFWQFTKRPDRYILNGLLMMGISILSLVPGYICMIVGAMYDQILAVLISIPLMIAGIIIYIMVILKFAMTGILLVDHPQMGVIEAFQESNRVMEGNKGRLFYILLSYAGFWMLSMLSCGIGLLWTIPYMKQTLVTFYQDVTEELDAKEMGQ